MRGAAEGFHVFTLSQVSSQKKTPNLDQYVTSCVQDQTYLLSQLTEQPHISWFLRRCQNEVTKDVKGSFVLGFL